MYLLSVEVKASVCVDNNGSDADEETALEWNLPIIPKLKSPVIEKIIMNNPTATLKVKSNVASALNFTLEGIIKT